MQSAMDKKLIEIIKHFQAGKHSMYELPFIRESPRRFDQLASVIYYPQKVHIFAVAIQHSR